MLLAKLAALAVVLSGHNANGAIQLVAHKVSKELTGAEITALATPGYNSTAGNFIAVWAVSFSSGQPPATITDSAGDVFTLGTLNKGTYFGQWFYAKNIKGDPFNVVTIHPATTGRATFIYAGMIVLEYRGVDQSTPIAVETAGIQGSLNGAWSSKPFDATAGNLVWSEKPNQAALGRISRSVRASRTHLRLRGFTPGGFDMPQKGDESDGQFE